MKTNYYLFVLLCTLFFSVRGYSQATYSQNFEAYADDWDSSFFYTLDEDPCGGSYSFAANIYSWFSEAQAISPSLGVSNGGLVTLSYNYKVVDYASAPPFVATQNENDWGVIEIYYATSPTGPFTLVQSINPTNHIESATCAAKTATFNPPAGLPVYIGIYTGLNDPLNDIYVIMDDFQVSQAAPLACNGAPAAATAVSSTGYACNTTSFNLSFGPANNTTGITYQWQQSTDGTTFTNVATGGTSATYTGTQTATHWYRVNITCTASATTTSSTPVRVLNTGTNCYCQDLTFSDGVEPITLVNFAGINNASTNALSSAPYIQNFTSVPPAQVTAGQSYPIIVKGNTAGPEFINYFKVYIDFNQNGILSDPGEGFELGSVTGSTGLDALQASGTIAIPSSALGGTTLMRVVKLYWYEDEDEPYPQYLNSPCAGEEHTEYGQAEDYLVTITPAAPCTTTAPTATAAQTYCAGATVANLVATGTAVKWYAGATGGTALAATTPLVNGNVYHASQTVGCESTARTAVTVTLTTVAVDAPANVNSCEPYTLPALTNGAYRTASNGGGTVVASGTVVNATTTFYIYNSSGTCTAEHTFVVTIGDITVDEPDDVIACGTYTLPELTNGAYHTAPNGGGSILAAGSTVNADATLYVYASSGNCNDESSFTVTILNAVADDPADISVCGSYILPELQNPGIYTTEADGLGDLLQPGDEITETSTIYIYSEVSEGQMLCTAGNSFTVTVNTIEADELADVLVCGEYVLPELENGAYFTGGSGLGLQLQAGDVITETTTLHIYAESGTTPNCTVDNPFTITIVTVEADVLESVAVDCTGYTLPALSAGNTYYTGSNGTGTQLNAGDVITVSQAIYIRAASSTSTPCYDESLFVIEVVPVVTPDDIIVEIVTEGGMPVVYDLYGVELGVDLEGTITFYATEEDAINGVNPLDSSAGVGQTTTYYATITVGDCVSEPFAVTFNFTLDNDKFDMAAFRYHPNPVADFLTISYDQNISAVTIFDMTGKKVFEKAINNTDTQIDFSGLASGVYTMKVQAEKNEQTLKIVKNK